MCLLLRPWWFGSSKTLHVCLFLDSGCLVLTANCSDWWQVFYKHHGGFIPSFRALVGWSFRHRLKWDHVKGKKEQRLDSSWWTVLDKGKNEGGSGWNEGPQLLWFELAESIRTSQHLTAVWHAFPFLFLTWMLILAHQVQQTVGKSCVWISVCLRSVLAPDDSVGGRLLMSAQEFGHQMQESFLFFCKVSSVRSASDHVRWDKFKSTLHVCDPPLAQ